MDDVIVKVYIRSATKEYELFRTDKTESPPQLLQ
jgi:hypothetical protein